MSPEERELLTHSIKLAEENNKMLRGMRRSARISYFFRIAYWVIILGSAFGVYYYTKPIIDPFLNASNSIQQNIQTAKDAASKLPSWLGGTKK